MPVRPDGRRGRTPTPWVVALAVALVLGLVVVAAVDRPAGTRPGSVARPNIVLIITDDQRVDELAGMPNVRSLLIDHGITFAESLRLRRSMYRCT